MDCTFLPNQLPTHGHGLTNGYYLYFNKGKQAKPN